MIIKNGLIATASDIFKGDIKISNGIVTEISENINCSENNGNDEIEEIIDATNLIVAPGGIDVHTHLNLDVGIAVAVDDFYTGTVAAACGGTTSIVDHIAFGPKNCSLDYMVNKYHGYADGMAVIDYGFHGVIQHVDDDVLKKMETLIGDGITSYKFYMTYDYYLNDEEISKVLKRAGELNLICTVHPENHGLVSFARNQFINSDDVKVQNHGKSRPLNCEAEAINRVLMMANTLNNAPIYIVHLSNGKGLEIINLAKEKGQKNIFTETCPQYLFLDESLYEQETMEALKYTMSPPLRDKENNDLLWKGIINNQIDVIATDHCPFNLNKEKLRGKDDFSKCPNGAPGVETRIPLLFSEGVSKKRISLNKFVDITSTTPAKIFGMYPKKGTIAVGSDADIILIDPNKKVTIKKEILHENVDYTPYENFEVSGYPVVTISRGEVIVKDGDFIGKKGRGQFIKREISKEIF